MLAASVRPVLAKKQAARRVTTCSAKPQSIALAGVLAAALVSTSPAFAATNLCGSNPTGARPATLGGKGVPRLGDAGPRSWPQLGLFQKTLCPSSCARRAGVWPGRDSACRMDMGQRHLLTAAIHPCAACASNKPLSVYAKPDVAVSD